MIIAQLPALQVVLPLLAAPLCVVLRGGFAAWLLAVATSWAAFAMAILLTGLVLAKGPISYAMGGWLPPWGIEYTIDSFNVLMLLIVSGTAAAILPFARASVADEIAPEQHARFYSAFLLILTGLLGMAATGDVFNLFVFIEISSIATYAAIALGRDRRALTAAFNYLVLGTVGATFYLIGVGLLYAVTGTLNTADLAARVAPLLETRTVIVGFAFISVGLLLKVALFPLHQWLPNAYAYAPSVITTFLAATATKVALYSLLRVAFAVFGASYVLERLPTEAILLALAATAILVASTTAIFQKDLKRLLAWSSLAQIGTIVLGVGIGTAQGMTGALLHMFGHALTKGALFMAAAAFALRLGGTSLEKLAGAGRRMPLTSAALVLAGMSLVGVPLTAGFVSKWTIVLAALERGWWPVAAFVLITSLLTLAYVLRVVEVLYFRPAADATVTREAPLSMLWPLWLMIAGIFYFGVDSSIPTRLATTAATLLLGVAP